MLRLAFFGSLLEPRFDPAAGSDVDATVEFAPSSRQSARQYFDFREALVRILGTNVDLVELDAMPDTRLRRIIERTRRVFHVETD
ncbi:MAG: nucleotidyltransferase domain-containing protein [Steroidobacteraceae bacterium]|nr:nucleotidyltransferase domain-containing protein [Steroidobacteraceae bacterium]